VIVCHDQGAGLKAIIVIHDTTLGPAFGGARMWPYATEDDAVMDALRLSRAMTYKNAAAGVNYGGGKAVIIRDPKKGKKEAQLRSYGRYVETLRGRYITTVDVGTDSDDMEKISAETEFVVGLPGYHGGGGDPSGATAYGVLRATEACAKNVFGSGSLKGKVVAIQGMGKVGSALARLLHLEGAEIVACDTDERATKGADRQYGATIVSADEIYEVDCDIFSPCALGGVLNKTTISKLKAKIVCGGANNQLAEDDCAQMLTDAHILYAPDYVANAGGVISLALEWEGHGSEGVKARIAKIYETAEQVVTSAQANHINTAQAADRMVEERIGAVRRCKRIYHQV
jgi:leucine dehydrogenase